MPVKDKVVLDLTMDDELRNYFQAKDPGEGCVLEIHASVDEVTNDQATLSVDEVIANQYGDEKKMEPEEPEDMGGEPPAAMVLMMDKKGKKKSAGY